MSRRILMMNEKSEKINLFLSDDIIDRIIEIVSESIKDDKNSIEYSKIIRFFKD